MINVDRSPRVFANVSPTELCDEHLTSLEPLVFKGLVSSWPLVQVAKKSVSEAVEYLTGFYNGVNVVGSYGSPDIHGRIFYNEEMTGLNFQSAAVKLDYVLHKIMQHALDPNPPLFYVGSTTVDACLPGFRRENDVNLAGRDALVSLWVGNKSRVAAHYDLPDNLACNVVGKRRFILFPPEQLRNLYVGPIDFTPAGQAISLVDFQRPDYQKYPRFKEALDNSYSVLLEPGDALFIPSMWWHYVEGIEPLNMLINYWWRQSPSFMGPPIDALRYALLAIKDLPKPQRDVWKQIFDYYIFEYDKSCFDHIPDSALGVLSEIDNDMARKLRAMLINRLKC